MYIQFYRITFKDAQRARPMNGALRPLNVGVFLMCEIRKDRYKHIYNYLKISLCNYYNEIFTLFIIYNQYN